MVFANIARACARISNTSLIRTRTLSPCMSRFSTQAVSSPVVVVHEQEAEAQVDNDNTGKQFAVVDFMGHQFKVTKGDEIMVDSLPDDIGSSKKLERVLCVGSNDYSILGRPSVPNSYVMATVEEHARTQKVLSYKKRRRKNSSARLRGHRSDVSILRIDDIVVDSSVLPNNA